jgi:hypothetical protein
MSHLNVLVRGHLLARRGYDRHSRELLIREADRLTAKIRDRFGRFDESDHGRCASLIRIFMNSEPMKSKPAAAPKPDPMEAKIAEIKERQQIADKLKRVVWF